MSEFRAEKPENRERMEELAIPKPSEAKEIPEVNDRLPIPGKELDWRARLAVLKLAREEKERLAKLKGNGEIVKEREWKPKPDEIAPPEIIEVPKIEQIVKAAEEQVDLEKLKEMVSTAGTYFELNVKVEDPDVLKKTFIGTLENSKFQSLDELRDSIRDLIRAMEHIQARMGAKMMLRGEKLKSATSEELEKRRKEDFESFTPRKQAKEKKAASPKQGVKKESYSATDTMLKKQYDKLISQGVAPADAKVQAKKWVDDFLGLD